MLARVLTAAVLLVGLCSTTSARPLSDFGGGCDGAVTASQNDVAFAAAFGPAAGEVIELPACVILISQPIVMGANDSLVGAGKRSTTIRTTSATAHMLDITSYYAAVNGVGLDSTVARTAGAAINIRQTAANFEIRDFLITRPHVGILANGIAVFSFTDGIIDYPAAVDGIGIRVVSGFAIYMNNVLVGCDPAARGKAAMQIEAAADFTVEYVQLLACNTNLLMVPSTGQEIDSFNAANSYFDAAGVDSFLAEPIGSGLIQRSGFVNCWFTPGTGAGKAAVRLLSGAGGIRGMKFVAARFAPNANNNGLGLVAIGGGIEGLLVSDSSGAGHSNALYIDGISSAIITNNRFGPTDGFSANTTAIAFLNGPSRVLLAANDLSGNTTSIWGAGSLGPLSKISNDNIGY